MFGNRSLITALALVVAANAVAEPVPALTDAKPNQQPASMQPQNVPPSQASQAASAASTVAAPLPVQAQKLVPVAISATGRAVTIEALSEVQKRNMELDTFKQMGVTAEPAAPVIVPAPVRIATPKITKPLPAMPYLASVVGPVGDEVATFTVKGKDMQVRAGDGIQGWEILEVSHGRVRAYRVAPAKPAKRRAGKVTRESVWINVGETLK